MKTKFILSLFMVSLFGCCHLSAQQQGLSYYYKGNPVSLSVNSQHLLVYADANKISKKVFETEFRVREWIEDGNNGILEAQVIIPNENYDSVVCVFKTKEYIIDVEPVIGDSEMVNTSRLLYVKLHNALDYPILSSTAQSLGAEIRGEVDFCDNWYELKVNKNSTGNSIEVANKFWETGFFANIDPGFILRFEPASVTTCVSDHRFNEQWGMQAIKACSAWKITKGDTNVKIAVIDMGVDTGHREFDSTHVVFSYDMDTHSSPAHCSCEIPPRDQNNPGTDPICFFHGLHVGGIIFANHNRDSVAGICPNAGLINLSHSFKLDADTCIRKLSEAINLSVLHGAKVINNSWSKKTRPNDQMTAALLEDAIDTALAHDCVVVFAAGNNSEPTANYPANYKPEILAVGSIRSEYELQDCTNYGLGLDIVAPGANILSTHKYISNNNVLYNYIEESGTSMAAPHVSGVAGLMFSINPVLTGKDVRDIIEQTVRKDFNENFIYDSLNENGTWDMSVGYGLLDAHRAVLKAAYHKVYGDTVLTLCDTSRHLYTVRAPHNANIDSVSFFWSCSGNLQMVAGQNTDSVWVRPSNGGDGLLLCHIIHDGDTVTSSIEIPIVADYPVYDHIALSNSITYPDTFVLSREIVVDSLEGLTWQNKTVLCTPDCRIIIRPGGSVTVNHTTLTSACPNRMWQGVEVTGNSTLRQILHNQGRFIMENGSVVENAFTAVRNCLATDSNYVTTGGVIIADSAFFINNRRAVEINPYAYSSQPGLVSDYASSFRRCRFIVNDLNHFTANDTVFAEHVRLWDVKGLPFKGCRFADSMSVHSSDSRGIHAEDAGLALDTHCGADYVGGCECPENHTDSCSFSGFTTAVEVNTTGNPYPVAFNQVQFSNNVTGVKINCNNFATVTRCDFDLQNTPIVYSSRCGLYLDNCTGYHIEENNFYKQSTPEQEGKRQVDGILVNNSGGQANSLYRNAFTNLSHGIYVMGSNSGSRSGLVMTCGAFSHNRYDIYIGNGGTVWQYQGGNMGADNSFDHTFVSSFYNAGSQSILYAYSNGNNLNTPYNPYNITTYDRSAENTCISTLCEGGDTPKSLTGFQSDAGNLSETAQSLSETYYAAVRTLMSDSLLDLGTLEQWHSAAQPIADPYSLTETRFCEGYAETFASDADDAEMANYAEFHAMKVALRNNVADDGGSVGANNYSPLQPGGHVNWYALTPAQIAQLQTIAERNTGRASVMAKGVLCFFHGICYEDDSLVDDNADNNAGTRAKRVTTDITDDAALTVYPNPTDDLLFVELRGAEIACIALYDLQGRMVTGTGPHAGAPQPGTTATMNMRNVPAGVYLLRVTDADGKEYHQKVVKR